MLFGSYAYGTPNEDSDLDICVVEKDYENRWTEKRKIYDILSFIDMPKDILNPKLDEPLANSNITNSLIYPHSNF